MAGRPRKPTMLKLVTGNPGRRPVNSREPKPQGNLVDGPDWLTDTQRQSWNYAIQCAPYGLLKRLDRSVLVTWVVAEDLHRQAVEKLNKGALLIKTPNGMPIQSPYLSIINKQALLMLRAASEMGFTPASRSKVEQDGGTDEPDEFFG